jgi:hypothetical protein
MAIGDSDGNSSDIHCIIVMKSHKQEYLLLVLYHSSPPSYPGPTTALDYYRLWALALKHITKSQEIYLSSKNLRNLILSTPVYPYHVRH